VEGVSARLRKFVPKLEAVLIPGMGHALIDMTGRVIPFLVNQG
jgi:hypothetical protein